MKKLILAAALSAVLSTAARANEVLRYECRGLKQSFASASVARKDRAERDPIVYISVTVWLEDGEPRMDVTHVSRSGREFSRAGQYPMNSIKVTNTGFVWRGIYARDPNVEMVGTLRQDKRDVYYTETLLKNGEVQWNLVSACEMVGE